MPNVIGIKYRRYRLRLPAGTVVTDLGCVTNFLACCQSGSGGSGTVAVDCCSDQVARTLYVVVNDGTGATVTTFPIYYDDENGWWYGTGDLSAFTLLGEGCTDIGLILRCHSGVWQAFVCIDTVSGPPCDPFSPSVADYDSCNYQTVTVDSCSPFYGEMARGASLFGCNTCISSSLALRFYFTE